ncbi:GH39 family glycosyl hydrolase [Edaphobacter albus]|uniref:GH39 family glycosyl hydrolase n=1 Tax=Edaphobacter sp. 4G125 TaxID=2763071 RepID=UPI001645353C|nr:glycosyl hydrolase family 39 [Edaphobacter sp. 4G125]QNI36664.1 glycosyl hydrolase family 39 [Edaphobacter sp. 4G125]
MVLHRQRRGSRLFFCIITLTLGMMTIVSAKAQTGEMLRIDAKAQTTPFPHFWERDFGSGRAILSLRESYRKDLRSVKEITDFQTVRFHGIFMDDVGLYDPDRRPVQFAQMKNTTVISPEMMGDYNFSYIDQIYDGLLEQGVRPFVELSFMPKKLASDPAALHPFWYKQNVSPPKDYAQWDAMITAFVQHLVNRYGLDEVSHWNFEVWNEPNIDFWAGKPKQETYFELYAHTALAIKKVSPRLRVGGPATAQAAWVGDFLRHCKEKNIPVDFASSHVYANDSAKDVFHTEENIPRDRMVCRSVRKVHDEITTSPLPKTPLIFSEYNASYANEPNVTDTIYMGPWLATTISQCDGLVESLSYWTFSDVFEEQGVVRTPFYGGFGLIAEDHIQKPAFHAFAMLHQLGDQRIALNSDSALATRRSDGSLAIALWNYAPPDGTGAAYTKPPASRGPERTFTLQLAGVASNAAATILRVDETHGNVIPAYDAMGRPAFPSREEIVKLRDAGKAAPSEHATLKNGTLTIQVPPQGLAVVLISNRKATR